MICFSNCLTTVLFTQEPVLVIWIRSPGECLTPASPFNYSSHKSRLPMRAPKDAELEFPPPLKNNCKKSAQRKYLRESKF